MAIKVFRKKWQKVTAICVAVFIALILLLALPVNSYWSPVVAKEIKKIVLKSSDSLYNVDFSSAELHILRGTVDIFDITLKPDTAIYNRRKKEGLAPNNLVELHVKRLTLSHVHPFKLYFSHRLDISTVAIDQPELKVQYLLNHKKDTTVSNSQTAWQKISKSLHSVYIGNILLGDVKLKYEDYSGNKLAISELKEMNLSAHDLLIDSATQYDRSRLLFCKEIIAELNNYSAKSPNGLYNIHFNHLRLSTLTSRLNIEGMSLRPIAPTAFFDKTTNDRFSFRLDSVQLDNFDFLNYHKYRIISTSALTLKNGRLDVYGNPRYTRRATDRVVTFPNAALFETGTDLKIDTVNLRHIDVFYTEYNQKSHKTGTVSFYNTNGRFLNITSRPAALQKNNICAVNLQTRFMNEGKLDLHFDFNLTAKNRAYSYNGTLGPMNLKAINPVTMPLTLAKIQNGDLKKFTFSFKATQTEASGKVLLLYNDAKVTLLKYDSSFNSLQSKPIASLFANNFVLKRNNPDDAGGVPREIYLKNDRTSQTPFFKYTWETLREGIKSSIGLDKKSQARTTALLSKLSEDKQQRLVKRELRKQRRAQRRLKRAEKAKQAGKNGGAN